jgi:hypothetical protein
MRRLAGPVFDLSARQRRHEVLPLLELPGEAGSTHDDCGEAFTSFARSSKSHIGNHFTDGRIEPMSSTRRPSFSQQVRALVRDAENRLCPKVRRGAAVEIAADCRNIPDDELKFIARMGARLEAKRNPLGGWLVALMQRELLRRRIEERKPIELSAPLLDLERFTATELAVAWQRLNFADWTGCRSSAACRLVRQLMMQLSCSLRARLLNKGL